MRSLNLLVLAGAVVSWATVARAGGYDTPMLYSARHMGMGGAAVGYVSDPSALFHNPAGLGHIERLSLLGDLSFLAGTIVGSPDDGAESIESETTFAPFFLVGAGARITDWLVVGLAAYPVASAGGTYEYELSGERHVVDRTKLVFIELSPGVALDLLGKKLRIGAGYRINLTSLERFRGVQGQDPELDFTLTGANFAGFRAGVQWQPTEEVHLGLSYRHKTVTDVTADSGVAIGAEGQDLETSFTLPSRLVLGVRGDIASFGGAIDVEYALNSQNVRSVIHGDFGGFDPAVANVFRWSDAVTLRAGVEYRVLPRIATRLGYIFDGKTSNKAYPTAFGTPAAPTHVFTMGGGFDNGPWQANVAYAYRFGGTEVTEEDLAEGEETCGFCGQAGDYEIALHGFYVDFSYDF